MAQSMVGILGEVCRLVKDPRYSLLADRELLERFRQHRDEAAFGELLRRHGAMVMALCHRVLGQAEDNEDAFQATFLLLAQKADSVRQQQSVASWLFGVAQRVAGKARLMAARRRRREARAVVREVLAAPDEVTWKELR